MRFQSLSTCTLFFFFASLADARSPGGLRSNNNSGNGGRKLQKAKSDECTIVVAELLAVEPGSIDETIFECEMDPADTEGYTGITRKINGNGKQMSDLKAQFGRGDIVSGESKLKHGGASYDDEDIFLPPGLVIAPGQNGSVRRDRSRRRLAVTKGIKPILAVRVTDSVGKAHPHNSVTMSDNIFGSFGDPVNLKSQLSACSFDQLTVQAGTNPPDSLEDNGAPGMVSVTISVTLEGNSRGTIRNAVTTAVTNLLGHSLPGPYQQVMYNLEGCYQDCGWAAYAYINSWNSVYQGNYYYMTGVQVHELGHNFNLAHSGGLNGATYTDHTGMMGNPLYSDDVGKMCFNAAKNFQLDWYNDGQGKMTLPTNQASFVSQQLTMVGIAEYNIRTNNATQPVTVKLETGQSTDYFIGFNRATGINSQNDEADNEVTITRTGNNGVGYSQSYMDAHLVAGESFTIPTTYFGGKTITVTVTSIDIVSQPGVATICVAEGTNTCAPATPAPTNSPVTQPPTTPPVTQAPVTSAPTGSPVTSEPTGSPVTSAPTKSPVTAAPVICTLAGIGQSCEVASDCCSNACSSGKKQDRVCEANGPTPAPVPAPPTTGSPTPAPVSLCGPGEAGNTGASCAPGETIPGGACCNGCSGGKPADRQCL